MKQEDPETKQGGYGHMKVPLSVALFLIISMIVSLVVALYVGNMLTNRYGWSADNDPAFLFAVGFWAWLNMFLLGVVVDDLSGGKTQRKLSDALDELPDEYKSTGEGEEYVPLETADEKKGCLILALILFTIWNVLAAFVALVFFKAPNVWEISMVVLGSAVTAWGIWSTLQAGWRKLRGTEADT